MPCFAYPNALRMGMGYRHGMDNRDRHGHGYRHGHRDGNGENRADNWDLESGKDNMDNWIGIIGRGWVSRRDWHGYGHVCGDSDRVNMKYAWGIGMEIIGMGVGMGMKMGIGLGIILVRVVGVLGRRGRGG